MEDGFLDILNERKYSVSYEVFPSRSEVSFQKVSDAAYRIADLHPAFMSVTYGAGGGTSEYTMNLARALQNEKNIPVVAHLTCIASEKFRIREQLKLLTENGIRNVLALRGDIPVGFDTKNHDYSHAIELVRDIKEFDPGICIAGACYPDMHPEAATLNEDIAYLKEKVDAGVDFLISQMFFDNGVFYSYMYRLREAGINVPVHPGIMPIVNVSQVQRTLKLSGTALPQRFKRIVDTFGGTKEAMKQAGIAYATDQIIDLFANGFHSVHVYSMNNPSVAEAISRNLSQILGL